MRNAKKLLEKKVVENPNPKPERESIFAVWVNFWALFCFYDEQKEKAQGPTNNGYCLQE